MPIQAQADVTVHRLLDGASPDEESPAIESVTLTAGDTLEEGEVPGYVIDRIKSGEIDGLLRIVSKKEADEVQERRAALATEQPVINASNADEDAHKA